MANDKMEHLKGRAKEAAGDLTEDEELEREGKIDQAAAKAKERVGDAADKAKERVGEAADKAKERVGEAADKLKRVFKKD